MANDIPANRAPRAGLARLALDPKDGAFMRCRDHGLFVHGIGSYEPLMSRDTPVDNPIPVPPPIRLVDVHKAFNGQPVLRGVSISFPPGRCTVVLGPSGSGKSVMLKHIVGLMKPDAGEVWFDGIRVDQQREKDMGVVRRRVGFLFQMGALFDSMSVEQNVEFPLVEHGAMTKQERRARVEQVLEMVGLPGILHKMPAELSGGQRKRVALARAVVLDPAAIFYDEPTTGLDPIRSDVINELIVKLQKELLVTSIVVTHDLTSAFKVADHLVMIHAGRVRLEGPPEVFKSSDDPIVSRFLRGEAEPRDLEAIRLTRPLAARMRRKVAP